MYDKAALKNQLIFQSSLITIITVVTGALGFTGITSFPAGLVAILIVFTAPFYFIIAIIATLVSIKNDKKYLAEITEEEKNNIFKDEIANFRTLSQRSTFGSTFALTLILPTTLILLSLMIFIPDVDSAVTDKYTIPMMIVGTMLVVASIWLTFSNHTSIFNRKRRIIQKLIIKEKAAEWKIVKLSMVWTTVVWIIGGILSIVAMVSAIFDGAF